MKHAHRGPAQFTFKVKKQMDEKFVCMCVCVCSVLRVFGTIFSSFQMDTSTSISVSVSSYRSNLRIAIFPRKCRSEHQKVW